jgi:hypothetical protein
MLVTLGTAYTTDAIVQFPVTVQSPYGPTYTTGSADTFATVAAAYGVSAEAAQAQFGERGSRRHVPREPHARSELDALHDGLS